MNCKKARILISAGFDGELSEKERVVLDRHLASCAECAKEKAQISKLSMTMHAWEDVESPEWLAQSFSYKLCDLQKETEQVKPRISRWLVGTAATGLVAVILAFFMLFNGQVNPVSTVENAKPIVKTQLNHKSVAPIMKPVVVEKQPAPVVTPKPRISAVVAPHSKRIVRVAYVPRHRHIRVYKPSRLQFYSKESFELASRGLSASQVRTEQQERARQLIIDKLLKTAGTPKGDAVTVAAQDLGSAGITMDESLERVRGVLRKAADVLANTPANTDRPAELNGGKNL